MRETCDIVVVGGGVIGCAIAHHLARMGRQVTLVDAREQLGLGASDAAMGGVHTLTESTCLGALSPVVRRSRDLYESWLEKVTEDSPVKIPVLATGDLQVALDDAEMKRLDDEMYPIWRDSPFHVSRLTSDDVRAKEPLLSHEVRGGYLLPDELALNPRDLMQALRVALTRSAGVHIRLGVPVVRVKSTQAAAEIDLGDGTRISADSAVVAIGYQSEQLLPQLKGLIFPTKGEAIELRPPGRTSYPLRYHVYAENTPAGGQDRGTPYLVPRHDGRVAVGVTYEERVSDMSPTPEGQALIRRWTTTLLPDSETWPMTRHWAGLRPTSPDHMPLIGYIDEHERTIVATGHSGLGVTLAPVTAEMVAALATNRSLAGTDAGTMEHLKICDPARRF